MKKKKIESFTTSIHNVHSGLSSILTS